MAKGRNSAPTINGFINFYKPIDMSSMDAVRRIKRITGQRNKVGHGGTMDPLAQGVLPICLGQATRLMDYVINGSKRYETDIELGATTSTYDSEGEVVPQGAFDHLTRELIQAALDGFIGTIEQRPPMYSAVKVQGQRLYKLARAGLEIEREARRVEIHSIDIIEFAPPKLVLDVKCGRGVYIRSLAHDLGQVLGCGGYVTKLVRHYCGGFDAADSVGFEELEASVSETATGWQQYLYPLDHILRGLQSVTIGADAQRNLQHGQRFNLGSITSDAGFLEQHRAYSSDGTFLALIAFDPPTNSWYPVKVFQSDSVSPYALLPSND